MRHVHTITEDDIGDEYLWIEGKPYSASGFIGTITSTDVGKRVYLDDEHRILQVESTRQYLLRMRYGGIK